MADWREVLRHYRLLAPVRLMVVCTIVSSTLFGLVMWMTLFLPLFWFCPEAYWTIGRFFRDTGFGLKGTIWWFLGYNVAEVGNVTTEILKDKSLFLVNHQSMLDGPTLTAMVGQKGITDSCAFMIDHWMKFTTYYGYYASFGGDIFVQQYLPEEKRQRDLENVAKQIRYMFNGPAQRKWMLYFPEGGLLHKRRPRSQAFAKKYGHPVLEHVALPRIGAMQTMLKALSPPAANGTGGQCIPDETTWKWIVDATVAYPEGKPLALSDLVTGARAPCVITICYRVYPASEVPLDTDGLQKWVFQRFVEKDAMLEHFYKHGHFSKESLTTGNGLTVRSHPQPVYWNAWAASLGLAVTSAVNLWSGYTIWSYLLHWLYATTYTLISYLY